MKLVIFEFLIKKKSEKSLQRASVINHYVKEVCRLNASGFDARDDMYSPHSNRKNNGLPYVEFELINTHLRYPDRDGDQLINEQIAGKFIDLIFKDPKEPNYINEGDMDYWFNEPEGGWRQGVARYYFLEEVPIESVSWPKLAKICDGTIRKTLDNYKQGDIIEGTCDSIHLHHGICIDFGCNYLGILPMNETLWEKIYVELAYERYEEIRPDFDKLSYSKALTVFTCKIRAKLDNKYFRWPLELDIVSPAWLKNYILKAGESELTLLAVAKNLSMIDAREYARASGRPYRTPRQYEFGSTNTGENHLWQQAQIDYYHEDHSQEFMSYDVSPLVPVNKKQEFQKNWCGSWRKT